jgi:hypothetical protein
VKATTKEQPTKREVKSPKLDGSLGESNPLSKLAKAKAGHSKRHQELRMQQALLKLTYLDTTWPRRMFRFLLWHPGEALVAQSNMKTACIDISTIIFWCNHCSKMRRKRMSVLQKTDKVHVVLYDSYPAQTTPSLCRALAAILAVWCRSFLGALLTLSLSHNVQAVALLALLLFATQGAVLATTSSTDFYLESAAGVCVLLLVALCVAGEVLLAAVYCTWTHRASALFPATPDFPKTSHADKVNWFLGWAFRCKVRVRARSEPIKTRKAA